MTSELKKRIGTGIVGVAALVALIVFVGKIGVFLIVTVLSLGMVFEYAEMSLALPDRVEKRYLLLVITWFISLFDLFIPQVEFALLVFSFMGLFSYFLWTAKRYEGAQFSNHFKELGLCFFGVIYLAFLPQYLRKIFELPQGLKWTLLFLIIVWCGDTGAYFAGKKFGKKKLYPEISPKKTREGALGGLLAGVVAAVLFKLFFLKSGSTIGVILLAAMVGVVAQIGDLCESFLKRAFQVKDSGSILPGHGGFLDRFDAIIFSLPVMYAGIRIFG